MHLDIINVFHLPTDAQENCFKKNIKIYIKTAPACFGLITIIREHTIRATAGTQSCLLGLDKFQSYRAS